MGRKVKYTDDLCRDMCRRALARFGNEVVPKADIIEYLGTSEYGFERMREWGEVHGYPMPPVYFEGVYIGGKGDEAEIVNARTAQAERLIDNAGCKAETFGALKWHGQIRKRLLPTATLLSAIGTLAQRMLPPPK